MLSVARNKRKSARARNNTSALPLPLVKIPVQLKRARQQVALEQLMLLRQRNNGNTLNNDICAVVKAFNDPYVTKSSLNYLLSKSKKGMEAVEVEAAEVASPAEAARRDDSVGIPACIDGGTSEVDTPSNHVDISDVQNEIPPPIFAMETPMASKVKECITYVTKLYKAKQQHRTVGGRVEKGTLDGIITDVEKQYLLPPGSINSSTVRNRIRKGNLTGENVTTTPPLLDLEIHIATVIVEQYRIGNTLRKNDIIQLARSASKGTPWARAYNDHVKSKRPPDLPISEEIANVGEHWYRHFRKRQHHLLKIPNDKNISSSPSPSRTTDHCVTSL